MNAGLERESKAVFQRYKVHLAAAVGVIGGMLIASMVFVVTLGADKARDAFVTSSKSPSTEAEEALKAKTDELITILEAISRWRTNPRPVDDNAGASAQEECLKRCRMDFPGSDVQSRTLLLDCTKGCLLQHSPILKDIRQRFH